MLAHQLVSGAGPATSEEKLLQTGEKHNRQPKITSVEQTVGRY